MNRLENIDRLFAAVQLLVRDDQDSNLLFREALDGAIPDRSDSTEPDQIHRSFYGKLISILRNSDPGEDEHTPSSQDILKTRVVADAVSRAFAPSFLQLQPGEQLLLFLSLIEGYDADSIAEITGFEPDHAFRQVQTASDRLNDNIWNSIDSSLSPFLQSEGIPRTWIAQNLRSFTDEYLDRPSALLQRYIESRLSPVSTRAVHHASADRVPSRKERSTFSKKWIPAIAMIFVTGLVGTYTSRYIDSAEIPILSVLELSIENADAVKPVLETSDEEQAERFIRSHFGRVIAAPDLKSATLAGVGSTEVAAGRHVPSILYYDNVTDQSIVVFGYTYSILDEISSATTVDDDLLRSLEIAGRPNVETIAGRSVVTWRDSDDLLFAVLPKGYQNPENIY